MTAPSLRLAADGHAPALARRHVRTVLSTSGLDGLTDDALLLVTELVTNGVVHAGTELELRLSTEAGGLRAEVLDRSPGGPPVVRTDVDTAREGGRGLFLLDALAVEWGTTHTRTGKSVWFRLGAPSPPTGPVPLMQPLSMEALTDPDLTWLLALPEALEERMAPGQVLRELVHRLADALGVDDALLLVEDEDGSGRWVVAASRGDVPTDDALADLRRDAQTLTTPLARRPSRTLIPLRGRGAAFGVLVLGSDGLDPTRSAVARLSADRLGMVLRDERAEMAQHRQRGSLSLLAEASDLFAGTLDVQLAVTLAAQLVVPRFAQWAVVYTAAESGLHLAAVTHEDEECTAALRVGLSSSAGAAFADGLARRLAVQRPVLVGWAELAAVLADERPGDLLALPLVARRRLLGGLLVARSAGSTYSAEDVPLLLDLARRAALAVDNARLYEERTAIAHALQASLLPPELPTAAEVDFGARYVPAGEGNEVGGDFYDVFALQDGSWAVAIGDVCGKGAEAAAITGLARNVLRLLLRDGHSPAEALRRLNDAILELGERGRFCTTAVAILRADGGGLSVTLASGGHPLPVLVAVDGRCTLVGRSGTVLGVVDAPDIEDAQVSLAAGESFVLYTDGVTERRRGRQMFGEDTLLSVLRRCAGRSADGVAGLLEQEVRAFAAEASRDDLAVLVARATGGTPVRRPARFAQQSV